MTAQDLARLDSGEALVAYLGQPDASPAVCDLRASGPHLTRFDRDVAMTLVEGLAEGRIDPDVWRRCADALFDGATPAGAAWLLYAVGKSYRSLVEDSDVETSPALQARLGAMYALYVERPTAINHANLVAPSFDQIRRAFHSGRLAPVATRFAHDLLAVVDLEQGRPGFPMSD